ncbi:MAG TPA: SigE family RNA polymerase sigma factor [Propionicimonas sp.]|nr:SigE family RNA polymerase sigma factor [Propionicimonas sp.]
MLGRTTAGRNAEFTDFVISADRYLSRTAFLICGDADLARELVQETFARTYAAWWRVRREDARGYAQRVLVNLNIDRRRRTTAVPIGEFEFASVGDPERGVDDRDEVARLLVELSPQQRRVIVLRYFNDLSEADVAVTLGISVGAVKSSCSRGIAKLRLVLAVAEEERR